MVLTTVHGKMKIKGYTNYTFENLVVKIISYMKYKKNTHTNLFLIF